MTAEIGWGVRTLVDLPEGTFICTYAGVLLTDKVCFPIISFYCFLNIQMADSLGADTYYADLDLIDSVENEKLNQGIDLLDEYKHITSKHYTFYSGMQGL